MLRMLFKYMSQFFIHDVHVQGKKICTIKVLEAKDLYLYSADKVRSKNACFTAEKVSVAVTQLTTSEPTEIQ